MSGMFKLGDIVTWIGRAGGHEKPHVGRIVGVVPRYPSNPIPCYAGFNTFDDQDDIMPRGWSRMARKYRVMFDTVYGRRAEVSYLVEVHTPSNRPRKPRLYWPRTRDLERIESAYDYPAGE